MKGFDDSGDARRAFTAEAAALEFGAGPRLLAADIANRLLVLADLGSPPTLADAPGFVPELESLRDEEYAVFSPGDECPDNCLLAPAGVQLLDFEGAGYRTTFLDAAYCRLPFPTCWCVRRLPAEVAYAATARRLLIASEQWEVPDLAGYPAFAVH